MCLTISLNSLSKFHKENQNITIHKKVMRDTNLMTFKTEKHCQNDIKRTWRIMKEITRKSKLNSKRFPKSMKLIEYKKE